MFQKKNIENKNKKLKIIFFPNSETTCLLYIISLKIKKSLIETHPNMVEYYYTIFSQLRIEKKLIKYRSRSWQKKLNARSLDFLVY